MGYEYRKLVLVFAFLRKIMLICDRGGSEDVMLDLMVRQLVKNYQRKTKIMERPKGSSKL